MDPILSSDTRVKEDGVETLEGNPTSTISIQKGFLPLQRQHPSSWNHFMTSIESPVLSAYSSPKRKSGWLISLICLVLLLATTQYYNPRNVRGISSRLFGPDYASRVVELPSDYNPIGLSALTRTDQVQFDKHSLILRGQRIFLQYGAFVLPMFSMLTPSAPENFTRLGCLCRRSGRTF